MDEVRRGKDFSIVVEVCSNYCCSHENVLICVYFDQSHADREREGKDERTVTEEQQTERNLFFVH